MTLKWPTWPWNDYVALKWPWNGLDRFQMTLKRYSVHTCPWNDLEMTLKSPCISLATPCLDFTIFSIFSMKNILIFLKICSLSFTNISRTIFAKLFFLTLNKRSNMGAIARVCVLFELKERFCAEFLKIKFPSFSRFSGISCARESWTFLWSSSRILSSSCRCARSMAKYLPIKFDSSELQ